MNYLMTLLLFFVPCLAALAEHDLSDEEKKIITELREKKRAQEAEARELKIPPGMGASDRDLACRKQNILEGLRDVVDSSEVLSKQLAPLNENTFDVEAKLTGLCIRAVGIAETAFTLMGNLKETRRGQARWIAQGSALYQAAILDSRRVNSACEKLHRSPRHELQTNITEVKSALRELSDKARANFNSALSENSHKK